VKAHHGSSREQRLLIERSRTAGCPLVATSSWSGHDMGAASRHQVESPLSVARGLQRGSCGHNVGDPAGAHFPKYRGDLWSAVVTKLMHEGAIEPVIPATC
jgi:Lhr-like helicase